MNHSEEASKLPQLPFIIGDLVLIATAGVIAWRSPSPLGPGALLAITVCIVFGAALAVVPFLANYARRQNAELSERQNQIAALARTTAESAEQLGIATAGLHGVAESSKQNLETIGRLPDQLQGRINDLTQQVAGSTIASQAAIKEDFGQLEATTQKISTALAKLEANIQAKGGALAAFEKSLDAALARATTQLDSFVSTAITNAVRASEFPTPPPAAPSPAAPETTPTSDKSNAATPPPAPKTPSTKSKGKTATPPPPPKAETAHVVPAAAPVAKASSPAKTAAAAATAPVSAPASAAPAPAPASSPASTPTPAPASAADPEPAPVSAPTAPSADTERPAPAKVFTPAEPHPDEVPVDAPPAPKPPRPRKTKSSDDTGLDLGLTPDPAETAESAATSDGATRLIATAYIGIGNKLFIRGDGPGLSWDKGVPLQFVSIGKWRWETPDAPAPVTVKLYKNDQIECPGLGSLTLTPGHQHEVNAGF